MAFRIPLRLQLAKSQLSAAAGARCARRTLSSATAAAEQVRSPATVCHQDGEVMPWSWSLREDVKQTA